MKASPLAEDGEFQRRVWLDVVGRIPTRSEAAAFLGDSSPDKREKLIVWMIDPDLELHAGNRPVRAAAPGGKPVEEIWSG